MKGGLLQVLLYSREECHLCETAKADLEALQDRYPHKLTVVDVDSSLELRQAFGLEVPVVEVGPYRLKAPFGQKELGMTLGAASDRLRQFEALDDAVGQSLGPQAYVWTKADRFTYWLSRHYMAIFNLFVGLYVLLPFLAPVLMKTGAVGPARGIYRIYGFACHQLPYRSFFLFGEQPVYPRAAAGMEGVETFNQATGLSEGDSAEERFVARDFLGNEQVGYKLALCERDIAIYGAILIFGLLFTLSGMTIPPLHWMLWVLLGLVPVGLDGVSQLLSQPPLEMLPYRESTPFLRVLTGGLFGLATAWFGYPWVEVTMRETRDIMADKLRRVKETGEHG